MSPSFPSLFCIFSLHLNCSSSFIIVFFDVYLLFIVHCPLSFITLPFFIYTVHPSPFIVFHRFVFHLHLQYSALVILHFFVLGRLHILHCSLFIILYHIFFLCLHYVLFIIRHPSWFCPLILSFVVLHCFIFYISYLSLFHCLLSFHPLSFTLFIYHCLPSFIVFSFVFYITHSLSLHIDS